MCAYDVLFNVDVDCCVVVFNGSKVLLILCMFIWFYDYFKIKFVEEEIVMLANLK